MQYTIRSALSSQLKLDGVRYWLDSKTALCWIRNQGEWKQFVKHRVNEILQLTNKDEWSYVSTHENPADYGGTDRHGYQSNQVIGHHILKLVKPQRVFLKRRSPQQFCLLRKTK